MKEIYQTLRKNIDRMVIEDKCYSVFVY